MPTVQDTALIMLATPEGRSALEVFLEEGVPGAPGETWTLDLPGTLRPLLRHQPANPALAASLGLDRMFMLEGLDPAELSEATLALRQSGWCEAVATDWIGSTTSSIKYLGNLPNDPLFNQQYALFNTGQTVGGQAGLPGADINALGAWDVPRGAHKITVAVFDAGISMSHPDLVPQLVPGWNFLKNSGETDDDNTSHGTHTAGIIAGVVSNREGVAGLAWGTEIMPVVVLNKYGFGNTGTLAEALVWAADQGVHVASVSIGYYPADEDHDDMVALRAAVQYATEQGMLICASAGNNGIGTEMSLLANYPETMAVGATDNRDQLWNGTSTGPAMSVVAPGVNILSTWDSLYQGPGENTYYARTGTSQATPYVAGLAALLLAINPDLEPDDLRLIIERTAQNIRPIGSGWSPQFGYGRIDAAAAAEDAFTYIDKDIGSSDRTCTADFNNDGIVNSQDFIRYLTEFNAHNWRADLSAPFGLFDSRDLLAFLMAYAEGCEYE